MPTRHLILLSIAAIGLNLSCAKDHPPAVEKNVAAFLQNLEREEPAQDLSRVQAIAGEHQVHLPPTMDEWDNLLRASCASGWKSRHALVLLADDLGRPYIKHAIDVLANSDTFTEAALLQIATERIPDDPQVASYSLELIQRFQGAHWPESIGFHGNQPFDTVRLQIEQLWQLPDGLTNSSDEQFVQWAKKVSVRLCRFDKDSGKWHRSSK